MALLKFWVDATQAKAELASLAAINKATATGVAMSWNLVNKSMIAGAAGIGAMAVGLAAAYGANAEFTKSLTHTRALSDLTTDQVSKMGRAAVDLGIQFGESSNVIADGLVVLSKAGLTYSEIMTAMPTIVKMMKANAVDFETAAKISIMSINAFSKEYSDLTDVADKTQKVVQATLLDLEDMQQALQYAGSTAALAGIPFESLAAMMGVLSDNAMVAGIAGRSVNMMMLDIIQNTDAVQRWADSMGIGVQVIKDGVLNINEIIPAFAKLGMNLETLIESQDIFTARALRSWGILIGHSGDYLELLGDINNATGELDRTVNIQMTSMSAIMGQIKEIFFEPFKTDPEAIEEIVAILEDLRVVVAELAPTLKNMVFTLMRGFADILPELNELLQQFIWMLSGTMKVLMFFGKMLAGMPKGLLQVLIIFKLFARSAIGGIVIQFFKDFVFGANTAVMAAEQHAMALRKIDMAIANADIRVRQLSLSQEKLTLDEQQQGVVTADLTEKMRALRHEYAVLDLEQLKSQKNYERAVHVEGVYVGHKNHAIKVANVERISVEQLTRARRMDDIQLELNTLKLNENVNAHRIKVLELRKEALAQQIASAKTAQDDVVLKKNTLVTQNLAAAKQMLATSMMGIGFGIYMMLAGYNKETRAIGAITTAIMVATLAYYALAAAKALANPLMAPAQVAAYATVGAIGIGAAAATVGLAYAAFAPEREMEGFDEYEMQGPSRTYGTSVGGFQGGTRVIGGTKPRMVMVHPQEQIVTANKETASPGSGAGLTINMAPGVYVLDEGGFVDWLDRQLSIKNSRELGRYIR